SVTVPLASMFNVPERRDIKYYYDIFVAFPEYAESTAHGVAADNARAEYLEDKLTWPVEISRQYHDGTLWYVFSVYGEELVASREPRLPLESLDIVSYESLYEVNKRVATQTFQVVTAAMLESAYRSLSKEFVPSEVQESPEDYALNWVKQKRY